MKKDDLDQLALLCATDIDDIYCKGFDARYKRTKAIQAIITKYVQQAIDKNNDFLVANRKKTSWSAPTVTETAPLKTGIAPATNVVVKA